jgi:hypothetical protein
MLSYVPVAPSTAAERVWWRQLLHRKLSALGGWAAVTAADRAGDPAMPFSAAAVSSRWN